MNKIITLALALFVLTPMVYGKCQVKPLIIDTRNFANTGHFHVVTSVFQNSRPLTNLGEPGMWKLLKNREQPVEGHFASVSNFSEATGVTLLLVIVSTDNAMTHGSGPNSPPPLKFVIDGLRRLTKTLGPADVIAIYAVDEMGKKVVLPPTSADDDSGIQAAFRMLDSMAVTDEGTQQKKDTRVEPVGVSVQSIIDAWRCSLEEGGFLQGDGYAREVVLLIDDGLCIKPSNGNDEPDCDMTTSCGKPPIILPKHRRSKINRHSGKKVYWCKRFLLPWLGGGLTENLNELVSHDHFSSLMPITPPAPNEKFSDTFTAKLNKNIPVLNGANIYVADFQSEEDLDGKNLRMNIVVSSDSVECVSPPIAGMKTLARNTRWGRILIIVLGAIVGILLLLLVIKIIANAMAARRERAEEEEVANTDDDAMAKLTVVEGPDMGASFGIVSDVTTIGRGSDMDVILSDPTVSRYHCQLIARDRVFEIRVTEGKSGIMLNGLQIPKGNLKDGDVITLGQTKLEFKLL